MSKYKAGDKVIYKPKNEEGVVTIVKNVVIDGLYQQSVWVRYDYQHPSANGQLTNITDLEHIND